MLSGEGMQRWRKTTMCGSRKYPYPSHVRLFDSPPPSPTRIFRSKGVFDEPPSPQEFPEFLNGDVFMSKWFWYFRKTESEY